MMDILRVIINVVIILQLVSVAASGREHFDVHVAASLHLPLMDVN